MLERGHDDRGHGGRVLLADLHRLDDIALGHRGLDAVHQTTRHQLVRLDENRRVNREVDCERAIAEQRKPEEHADDARTKDNVVEAAARLLLVRRRVRVDRLTRLVRQLLSEGLERRHRCRTRSNEDRRRRHRFLDLIHLVVFLDCQIALFLLMYF